MNSLLLTILAMIGYLLAYRFYGRFLGRRLFRLQAGYLMPSHEFNDGVDYVPTKKHIIFGHHFTTIAGLGPIVGPAIGVIWGWLPAFIWVFLGSIFMGAVHDFGAMVVSLRNQGRSIEKGPSGTPPQHPVLLSVQALYQRLSGDLCHGHLPGQGHPASEPRADGQGFEEQHHLGLIFM